MKPDMHWVLPIEVTFRTERGVGEVARNMQSITVVFPGKVELLAGDLEGDLGERRDAVAIHGGCRSNSL